MKLDLKFNSKIDLKHFAESASSVWQKTHTLLFFVILIAFIAFGGYIWQQNVSSGGWSNDKKQEYISTQSKEIIFKEEDFQKVLDDISLREEETLKEYQPIKDIFKPY